MAESAAAAAAGWASSAAEAKQGAKARQQGEGTPGPLQGLFWLRWQERGQPPAAIIGNMLWQKLENPKLKLGITSEPRQSALLC